MNDCKEIGSMGSPEIRLEEATIADLQAAMAEGRLTSRMLVEKYLERVESLDAHGPTLHAIIELNPEAKEIASSLDRERQASGPRGLLHGIPVLLKDNIDTADRMMTTAGSQALVGPPASADATVAEQLRRAGAVILGKTNLSEWANFRSTHSSSGWSARGGQTRNPHILDRNPGGSSSGSGVAVAAGFAAVSIGTETDGSIISPATANGVVGLKPTVGLTSRAGVIPIAFSQDTVGVHARVIKDAAIVLGAMTGVDPRDPATEASEGKSFADYTRFLDRNGLSGARIGVVRNLGFGRSEKADTIVERAIQVLRDCGAVIIDPANLPSDLEPARAAELEVLLFEFKHALTTYLASRADAPIQTLAQAIAYNEAHSDTELRYFGQELFIRAEAKGPLTDPAYREALEASRRLSGPEGLDRVMDKLELDALIAPSGIPAWPIDLVNGDRATMGSSGPAARVGYPLLSVPAGSWAGLPVNVTFMGRAFSEPTLLKYAFAFEAATNARRPPQFLPTLRID
jgi:amidase